MRCAYDRVPSLRCAKKGWGAELGGYVRRGIAPWGNEHVAPATCMGDHDVAVRLLGSGEQGSALRADERVNDDPVIINVESRPRTAWHHRVVPKVASGF